MAKLIQEIGAGSREIHRLDGRVDHYMRLRRSRIRYGLFYADGSRVIRSKMTGRKAEQRS